jgi:hypothetical protein
VAGASTCGASLTLERYTDLLFGLPNDLARLPPSIAFNDKIKRLWNSQRGGDSQTGSALGHVPNGAGNSTRTVEFNDGGLQNPAPDTLSLLVHDAKTCDQTIRLF